MAVGALGLINFISRRRRTNGHLRIGHCLSVLEYESGNVLFIEFLFFDGEQTVGFLDCR